MPAPSTAPSPNSTTDPSTSARPATGSAPGTIVLRHGAVFTADAARSWASAVAIVDGRIAAVGGDDDVAPFLPSADEVVDLAGRAVWPGFHDAHAHPVYGGVERLRCDLSAITAADAYVAAVADYAHRHPDRPWIIGGGWSMGAFPGGTPSGALLDAVVPDRPVYLPNRDHHSAWVNSAALRLAGVTASSADPVDGRIERDADGTPTGLLHEGAMDLVARLLPATTQEEFDEGLAEAQRHLHSLGIVGWQDAMVHVLQPGPSSHASYLRAQSEGWLTARVSGALWWERGCRLEDVSEQVKRLAGFRDEANDVATALGRDARYRVTHAKVMQDGVIETFTAALLDPYLDRCGHPTDNAGISFLDRDVLFAAVAELDAAGFGVHFHSLGDRAVRDVLDALEHTRMVNGHHDRRHHLAHLQVVHPDDVARFRALGASANCQALWACHEVQMDELTIPFLGPRRAAWQYPFGDLHRDGATLVMGSDWPVTSPDPLAGIHVAVNRYEPGAPASSEPLVAAQQLPLGVAVAAYTAGSAHVTRLDGISGTITPGHDADLVVLDGDPFSAPTSTIHEHRVQRTYVAGHLVHHAD